MKEWMFMNMNDKFDKINTFLATIVGLADIKDTLIRFVALSEFERKTEGKYPLEKPNLHMVFRGNAGTGKTWIAGKLAELYSELEFMGCSPSNPAKMTALNGANLLVGGSAARMRQIVADAMPGVLLIDEAYSMTESMSGIGDEIIAALLTEMEDNRHQLAVCFAGYIQKMYKFMNFNPGLRSRVGVNLNFADYTPEELLMIICQNFKKTGFDVTQEAKDEMFKIFRMAVKYPDFGNGRFARALFVEVTQEHAINTNDSTDPVVLKTICAESVTNKVMGLLKQA
jgi:stage V sporulation protein K